MQAGRLTVLSVGEREVGVWGCGRKAGYVVAPNGGWANDNGVKQAPEGPPPVEPAIPE
jgi:hypothetical protein